MNNEPSITNHLMQYTSINVSSENAMLAQWRMGRKALHILIMALDGVGCLALIYLWERTLVSIVQEASGPVWTAIEKSNFLVSFQILTPTSPAHRETL
jgi:hypothetical protein